MNDTNFLNAEPCSGERALPPKNLINAAELVRRQWRPHGWLLWQMVPRSGITLLAGETASGKTFLGLDLALGMASGRGRAWDMEIGAGIREQGSGNSRERAPRVPNDANLMRNGTSRIPYEDPSQAQDDKNICRERPLGVPDKGKEWSVPTCPGSEADRVPYKDPYAVHFVSQAQDDKNICRERPLGVPDKGTEWSVPTCPGSEADRVPYKDPYAVHFVSQAQDDCTPCTERTLAAPFNSHLEEPYQTQDDTQRTEWSVPTCPGSEADRVPYKDPYAVHFVSQAQDDRCTELLYRATRDQGSGNSKEKYFPISHQLSTMSREARVRYLCADADPNLIAERVLRLCRGYPNGKKGMGIDVPDALDLDFTAHQFSDPQSFTWLAKEVVRQGYQLLIFDGLAQYLPGMADGSAPTVGAFLRGVRQLASQTGVSVLLIHQFNKRQAARLDKWGLPTSQGEERIRGSSELLAGVDSVLLLSRPDAIALGAKGRALLKVVKNRLGQAGARLQFTIVDGDHSLHLLFERLARQAQPKPRRMVDAALDEMMRILMEQDQRKFDRAELTKLLQERMNLPGSRTLAQAFGMLGKEEKVRVERKENGRRSYSWAAPGTGAMEKLMYGLPPAMAIDLASSYLLNKARLNLADQQLEKMQNHAKPSDLEQRLADFLTKAEEEEKEKK